jgi:hypothetical protein
LLRLAGTIHSLNADIDLVSINAVDKLQFTGLQFMHGCTPKILGLGAGTGGATRVAMKALSGANGLKRYRQYTFTDLSPGFLTAAQ